MQRTHITRALGAAVLTAPLLFIGATANAGGAPTQGEVEPSGDDTAPVFDFEGEDLPCEDATYLLNAGDPDDRLDITEAVTPDPESPTSGTMDLTGVPAATYVLEIDCVNDRGEFTISFNNLGFTRLMVTKVVEGDPDEDTTFTIEVACEQESIEDEVRLMSGHDDGWDFTPNVTFEREFGADGGSQPVIQYVPSICEVDEVDDGGAESSSIDNGQVELFETIEAETTVTNVFADAEETDEGDTDVEEVAEAADPVEATPTFTG